MPVNYGDLDAPSRKLLSDDFYHTASAVLDVKTVTPSGVTFRTKGKATNSNAVSGSVEAKFADKNLAITQTWATDNLLSNKIELKNAFTSGLNLNLSTGFQPSSAAKTAKIDVTFLQPSFNSRVFVDPLKASVLGDIVVAVPSVPALVLGGEAGYDVGKAAVTKYSLGAGYSDAAFSAALTASNNLSVIAAGYYHKVSAATEVGAKASWDTKSSLQVAVEVGAKQKLDAGAFVKGKVNSQGIAAVSYSQLLRPGVTLGLGASFDTLRFNEPVHKAGLSLTFNA